MSGRESSRLLDSLRSSYESLQTSISGNNSTTISPAQSLVAEIQITEDYEAPPDQSPAAGLLRLGYDKESISNPAAKISWQDFLTVINWHCEITTNSKRKMTDKVNYLSPLHVDGIMRWTQCDENYITMKRFRYFCQPSQEGGPEPPLFQMESTINRYPNCWEKGLIVGMIGSNVVKQYLLGHGQPTGSFILRMQFNSPSNICASSVQIHPQTGAVFIDHLTIPQQVAPDDNALLTYLAKSPIHQILLPTQQLCTPSMLSQATQSSKDSYRSTDVQMERTNEILLQMHTQDTHATKPVDSIECSLDPKVLEWLTKLFGDTQTLRDIIPPFESEQITFASLEILDADDLKEMNIPVGPRKEILQALQNREP